MHIDCIAHRAAARPNNSKFSDPSTWTQYLRISWGGCICPLYALGYFACRHLAQWIFCRTHNIPTYLAQRIFCLADIIAIGHLAYSYRTFGQPDIWSSDNLYGQFAYKFSFIFLVSARHKTRSLARFWINETVQLAFIKWCGGCMYLLRVRRIKLSFGSPKEAELLHQCNLCLGNITLGANVSWEHRCVPFFLLGSNLQNGIYIKTK